MNELPVVPRGRSWVAAAAAVIVIALLATGFVWLAYSRNRLQRESAQRVERQTQVAQSLQQPAPGAANWRQVQQIPTGLTRPVALAWTPQALYVAGDSVIRVLDRAYRAQQDLTLPGNPTAIDVSGDRLIVGFRDHIAVHDMKGAALAQGPSYGPRTWISAVAAVGDEVWVADSGNRLVHRCRSDGSVIADLGRSDAATGYPGLLVPSPHLDLALTGQGSVLLNNPGKLRVEVWDVSGKLLRHFGKAANDLAGFCGCCNPIALAALPDGRVVTAEKGLVRVKVYRADGSFDGLVAAPPVLSRRVASLDLAATAAGQVLVLDPRARSVLVFEEQGRSQPLQADAT